MGVVEASVRGWEAGRQTPTAQKLEKLAALYGITVSWLLGIDPTSHVDIADADVSRFFRVEWEEMTEDVKDIVRHAIRTARELHRARKAAAHITTDSP